MESPTNSSAGDFSSDSEDRFRQMANAAPVFIWTSAPDKSRTWFNDQWLDFTGKRLDELTGQGWQEGVHPDDLDGYLGAYHVAFDAREPFLAEYRLRHKDGSYHWMLVRCTPQYGSNGEFRGYIGTCTDITDRKHAEELLGKRSKENGALFQLTDRLNRAENLEDVYSSAMDSILTALECDRTSILLFDESGTMSFVGSIGISDGYIAAVSGHSPWKRGDRHCSPICVTDVEQSDIEEPLKEAILREGIRGLAFIPLASESELIGKFMVYFNQPHEFTDQELELSLTIGRQLVIAIQRKVAEQELMVSEQSLRLALEAGRMGTWEWTIATGKLEWSSGLEMIYGYEPGTFPGTFEAYISRIHPEDREHSTNSISIHLENAAEHNIEHRVVWEDGSVHWVEGRGHVVRDQAGKPLGMKGVCVEITNRKKVEHDFQFLADASATLTSATTEEDLLERVASLAVPGFADWCSVDLVNAEGRLQRLAVCHIDPNKVELAYELQRRFPPNPTSGTYKILKTGKSLMIPEITKELLNASIEDPDIKQIAVDLGLRSFIGVPINIRDKTVGVITFVAAESGRTYTEDDRAIAEDLADRVAVAMENSRLYRELLEVGKRKDAFLATLAHELRNPLAPIRYALGILGYPNNNPETIDLAKAAIDRHVSHMVRLVDDLLDVSRITQGKLVLQISTVDLKDVLDQAIETAIPLLKAKNQTLNITHWTEKILLQADPARLAQVFSNLMSNASKFTPVNGNIWITVQPGGESVTVKIRDDGQGIAPEVLPTVFDMFSQADSTLEQTQSGLGIGLSLVSNLVELHEGSVSGNSEGLGKGSEFVVQLPILPRSHASNEEASSTRKVNPGRRKRRILVVDDNLDSAEMLAIVVQMLGHETAMAHDGEDAVAKAKQFLPEAIFMDIGLPHLNGYEAAKAIREESWGKDMFLIALTGWGQDSDRQKSRDSGFDMHLVKPVEADTISDVLSEIWKEE